MSFRREGTDVEYGLLEAGEVDGMARLLGDTFSRDDPPSVALELSSADIRSLVSAFGDRALSEQLTVVARDASTGQLVGALLSDDFGTPLPPGLGLAAPRLVPIGALLRSLDEQYRARHAVEPGTHLHLFMLGVSHGSSGRGIARKLIETCVAHGKRRGYSTAVTEATGRISQHLFRKLGFEELFGASYQGFLFDGQPVFSSIAEPEGTLLMVRRI